MKECFFENECYCLQINHIKAVMGVIFVYTNIVFDLFGTTAKESKG